MKVVVWVLALGFQVVMVPSMRAQPQLDFDRGGAASGIVHNAGVPFAQTRAATLPPQRPGGISYAGAPGLLLSGFRESVVVTPHLGSSAFVAAKETLIHSANLAGRESFTGGSKHHVESAPKGSSSKTMGSPDAITIHIRPPSFLMLLGDVFVVALLGYGWRRRKDVHPDTTFGTGGQANRSVSSG